MTTTGTGGARAAQGHTGRGGHAAPGGAAMGRSPAVLSEKLEKALAAQASSRRRDCHSAGPPSPFSRRFNRAAEGVSAK